jgi:8-oxo-dGTP pyrophosphatase MutT (NUDIX family)
MKSDRQQVGALCVRRADDGSQQVLLITSRGSGRWVIPKGWPTKRLKDHKAAAREAEQEAGVLGKVKSKPIGNYTYPKTDGASAQSLRVAVFLLSVRRERRRWPERDERRRAWFPVHKAAKEVSEPELRTLIRGVGQPRAASR